MSNLLHNIPIKHKVAIVNERGEVRGHLHVLVELVQAGANSGAGPIAHLNFRSEDFLRRSNQSPENYSRGKMNNNPTSNGPANGGGWTFNY
jgi:hypothetical protein